MIYQAAVLPLQVQPLLAQVMTQIVATLIIVAYTCRPLTYSPDDRLKVEPHYEKP